jgi:hypothetical protein
MTDTGGLQVIPSGERLTTIAAPWPALSAREAISQVPCAAS